MNCTTLPHYVFSTTSALLFTSSRGITPTIYISTSPLSTPHALSTPLPTPTLLTLILLLCLSCPPYYLRPIIPHFPPSPFPSLFHEPHVLLTLFFLYPHLYPLLLPLLHPPSPPPSLTFSLLPSPPLSSFPSSTDMESIDSLAKAINQFSGGMVLVSHDMRLISQVFSSTLCIALTSIQSQLCVIRCN